MYFGELKEKTEDYRNGHATGITRAFDTAINCFELPFPEDSYTVEQIVKILKKEKASYLEYCDTFGMGTDEPTNYK